MALINSPFPSLLPTPATKPAVDYVSKPATDEHAKRISLLGIEESLLRPSVPPRSITEPRSLAELPRSYKPARFRLLGTSVPDEEKSDTWFELLFVDVFAHARRFVNAHFGFGNIPRREEEDEEANSLWLEGGGFSKEFLAYASLVARQDSLLGGWEALLRSETQRTAMVCGIIAKALEDGAWDELLFGASEEQQRLLAELDLGTVQCDGYERTALRRQTINSLLGSSPLPPNFWSEVDILTSRILALLLPLLDLLDTHFPSSATNPLASIHADLHCLVSKAGFLAVSMRRSDTIFRLIWPSPGDLSDSSHSHDKACEVIYQVSKHAAEAIEKGIADVAAQDRARERGVPTPTVRKQMPFWKRVMLVGKVKIAVWPGLERYRRLVEGGTEAVDEVVVRKAVVGYYCGRAGGEADGAEGRPQLREYVRGIVERRREQRLGGRLARFVIGISLRMWLIVAVLLVSGIGVLLFPGSIGDGWGGLDGYPEGYPGVQSVTDLEQQDWTVESVLARFGRGMIADLFKGTFGGHGGGHEAV